MVSPVRALSHLAWAGSANAEIRKQFVQEIIWEENDSLFTHLTYKIGNKKFPARIAGN